MIYDIIPATNARLIQIMLGYILLIMPPSKEPSPIGIEVSTDTNIRIIDYALLSLRKIPTASPSGISCIISEIAK